MFRWMSNLGSRVPSALIRSPPLGLRFLQSGRRCSRYNRCSVLPSPRIRRMPRWPTCSSGSQRNLSEWRENGHRFMQALRGSKPGRAAVARRMNLFGCRRSSKKRIKSRRIWPSMSIVCTVSCPMIFFTHRWQVRGIQQGSDRPFL